MSGRYERLPQSPSPSDIEAQCEALAGLPSYDPSSTAGSKPQPEAADPHRRPLDESSDSAGTVVYALHLAWPIVPKTINRQVMGVVFQSQQHTIEVVKRYFPELLKVPDLDSRISLAVALDRSTTLPLVGPMPSGAARPSCTAVSADAWSSALAPLPHSIRVDVGFTEAEAKKESSNRDDFFFYSFLAAVAIFFYLTGGSSKDKSPA